MARLEDRARERGYKALILETNPLLVPAMKLYEGLGYTIIDNYGAYKICRNPSVCGKSCDMNRVIPAKAGIHVFSVKVRGNGFPPSRE